MSSARISSNTTFSHSSAGFASIVSSEDSVKRVEPVEFLALQQFPSFSSREAVKRREDFSDFLKSVFPIDIPVRYGFEKTEPDGSCFFHAYLCFMHRIGEKRLPNKASREMNEEEQLVYALELSRLRESVTEAIRGLEGPDYVLHPEVPEYQPICKSIVDSTDLGIIVVHYDADLPKSLNKVYQFTPESGVCNDYMILVNVGKHFTLAFPTSSSSSIDTKTIRRRCAEELTSKAYFGGKLA